MNSHLTHAAIMPLLTGVAVGLVACGGGGGASPSGPPTTTATATASGIVLSAATLSTDDFSSGATEDSPIDVPDLTSVKCTPNHATGMQQQFKSEVTAGSGRVYGNVVAGFDTADNAHAFMQQFFTATQSCSDASSQPVQDTFGTYSFYYTIHGSPTDLSIEGVQLDKYLSIVIQYLPSGTPGDLNSLRSLVQASVNKLKTVNS